MRGHAPGARRRAMPGVTIPAWPRSASRPRPARRFVPLGEHHALCAHGRQASPRTGSTEAGIARRVRCQNRPLTFAGLYRYQCRTACEFRSRPFDLRRRTPCKAPFNGGVCVGLISCRRPVAVCSYLTDLVGSGPVEETPFLSSLFVVPSCNPHPSRSIARSLPFRCQTGNGPTAR